MSKRYFTSEESTESEMVKVKAIKRGTVSGRYGIFHVDPKGKDPKSRRRTVRLEVARELKEKGLVEILGRGSARDDAPGNLLPDVIASRRGSSIEKDGEETRYSEVFGSNGADTRDTTAFASDPSKSARVNRFEVQNTTGETDELDDEEIDGDDDDNDTGQEGSEADAFQLGTSGPTSTGPADDALRQEGNAGGGDAPRDDDVSEHAGSDQGSGAGDTDASGAATDLTDTETGTTAAQPAAAAPRPRRPRGTAAAD